MPGGASRHSWRGGRCGRYVVERMDFGDEEERVERTGGRERRSRMAGQARVSVAVTAGATRTGAKFVVLLEDAGSILRRLAIMRAAALPEIDEVRCRGTSGLRLIDDEAVGLAHVVRPPAALFEGLVILIVNDHAGFLDRELGAPIKLESRFESTVVELRRRRAQFDKRLGGEPGVEPANNRMLRSKGWPVAGAGDVGDQSIGRSAAVERFDQGVQLLLFTSNQTGRKGWPLCRGFDEPPEAVDEDDQPGLQRSGGFGFASPRAGDLKIFEQGAGWLAEDRRAIVEHRSADVVSRRRTAPEANLQTGKCAPAPPQGRVR